MFKRALLALVLSLALAAPAAAETTGVYAGLKFMALPGFPWVADLLMSFPEGTNEGYGPIFSDSGADRALVC